VHLKLWGLEGYDVYCSEDLIVVCILYKSQVYRQLRGITVKNSEFKEIRAYGFFNANSVFSCLEKIAIDRCMGGS
jgi:hypothetical protein